MYIFCWDWINSGWFKNHVCTINILPSVLHLHQVCQNRNGMCYSPKQRVMLWSQTLRKGHVIHPFGGSWHHRCLPNKRLECINIKYQNTTIGILSSMRLKQKTRHFFFWLANPLTDWSSNPRSFFGEKNTSPTDSPFFNFSVIMYI